MPNKRILARQMQTTESMVLHVRETIAEASRQSDDGQHVNAFILMRGTWPVIVYCVHRRYTGASKARARRSTQLISGLSTSGLSAAVVAKMREGDIAAVMGDATPTNTQAMIEASLAALNATELATMRRQPAANTGTKKRRPVSYTHLTLPTICSV